MTALQDKAGRRNPAAPGATGWLGFAAAPTFAAMALLTIVSGGEANMICAAHGVSLSGMVPMYALMSAFHSAPWLKLIARFWSGGPPARPEVH